MKILITSVDALWDFTYDRLYPGITDALDFFLAQQADNQVYVISIKQTYLHHIPSKYNPTKISSSLRNKDLVTDTIAKFPQIERSNVIILGAKDSDFFLAVNEQVLLLSANYVRGTKYPSLIKYGRPIASTAILKSFFAHYLGINNPWYYNLEVTKKTKLLALTNANTFSSSEDMVLMNNHFKSCLKSGKQTYKDLFLNYFLMSVYSSEYYEEFREVDYWSIYPSSSTDFNHDLHDFMEVVRILFNGKPKADNQTKQIFVRTRPTRKRHEIRDKDERIKTGLHEQLTTMTINPYYGTSISSKLTGKSICIIDDYSTYGTSCEAARALLREHKIKSLLFVVIGKYGTSYYKNNLSKISLGAKKSTPEAQYDYTLNTKSNKSLLDSLADLIS